MIDPTATDPRREPRFERLTITSKGFQFLLEDRQMQLWQILMFYITSMQADGEDAAGILSLFFSLGCMQLGQGYSVSKSFPRHAAVLRDLEQYGFVYLRNDEVFPTHLATALCSGDTTSSRSQSADDKRFLILETNYKIYAYTSNELEIAILNLFVDIRIRYPNLVVGKLDRSHVKAAMDKGISAKQIIAYLSSHAHPQMYNHPPPLLHSSVTDQLHLWDQERNRLGTQESEYRDHVSCLALVLTVQPTCSASSPRSYTRILVMRPSATPDCSTATMRKRSSSLNRRSARPSESSSKHGRASCARSVGSARAQTSGHSISCMCSSIDVTPIATISYD
jgi:hypothetical protein